MPEYPQFLSGVADRMRAFSNSGAKPAAVRQAATVLLLREASRGLSAYMLHRHASMAFAGGVYAYPGGAADPRDEQAAPWAGPSPEQWSARLGVPESQARTILCTAVRETFEETGVLLASSSSKSVVGNTAARSWEKDRAALVAHELSLADVLARRGLVLSSGLLHPWARWITPEFEPRRYDTWFFVAALPASQRARNVSTEARKGTWILPERAVAMYLRGQLPVYPPTISALRDLAAYRTTEEVLTAAHSRDLSPVRTQAAIENDEIVLSLSIDDSFITHLPRA
jgi:8-oxo-dGTP pyrophosphatase MutT (NUDIX family)